MISKKGFAQIDYVIATGIFLVVFALVVQYVGNFFSGVVTTTNIRIMTTEANELLYINKASIPEDWPYITPNASVVLYMHLDNSTLDSSIYGNNGVAQGANCSASVAGKLDSACSFDGINTDVNVPYSLFLSPTQAITIEAWFNTNNRTADQRIVSHTETGGYQLSLNENIVCTQNSLCMLVRVGGNYHGASYPVSNISNNQWYHVAGTYDGETLRLYINGQEVSSNTTPSGAISYSVNNPLCIGSEPDSSACNAGSYFNGSIDDIVIWNMSLSPSEVYQRYAYENTLRRIGIATSASRFSIVLNNSRDSWVNQSSPWVNLTDELVAFNYSDLGIPARVSSTYIYDDNGNSVPYNINGNVITFNSSIAVNTTKNFTVYFDDDANFQERTVAVAGSDNLTEKIFRASTVGVVQYRKILFLNSSNYTIVRNATQTPRDFRITLTDLNGQVIFTFGPQPPESGNIVATRRFVVYQNATAAIRGGALNVQVW